MTDSVRFLHISPDHCGAEALARLFHQNGHKVARHEDGRLAADIAWASVTGWPPFQKWPEARLFTGLYRLEPWWRPPLAGWRGLDVLRRHFPQARFILTTRNMDDWLLDRMTHGPAAQAEAAHRQVEPVVLPDLWAADWRDHLQQIEAFFGDDPALIRVDLDAETPADLCRRLSAFLPMPKGAGMAGWWPKTALTLDQRLLRVAERAPATPRQQDEAFVEDVAAFCLRDARPAFVPLRGVSRFYCEWDGDRRVLALSGERLPIRIGPQPGHAHDIAVTRPDAPVKMLRAEGVINDILRLGRRDPVHIDMEDSRWIGSAQGDPLPCPVLCHNRRDDARNVVLWPLPGHYGPGFPGFHADDGADPVPFGDKRDQLVWRGMISGSERREGVRPGPASHVFLRQLGAAGDDPAARAVAWDRLARTNRLAVVRRIWDNPDYDLGVVMAWSFRKFAADPFLAPYCRPRQNADFFNRFRYRLCMAGYDHGSNFMASVNSRSVLLKEEDGWQVYYSGRFRPWQHYIPLARYCDDLEEKLAWARDHPAECREMSRAARAEAARFASPALTCAIRTRILDGLAALR